MKINIIEIEIGQILPLHEVNDFSKFAQITESMKSEGWTGRPLLVIETQGMFQAVTGSHRFASASAAKLEEIPCVLIDNAKMDEFDYSSTDFYDDCETFRILCEIGDEEAAFVMEQEERW